MVKRKEDNTLHVPCYMDTANYAYAISRAGKYTFVKMFVMNARFVVLVLVNRNW